MYKAQLNNFTFFFFVDTLISNNISFGPILNNFSLNLTIQSYEKRLNILTTQTIVLDVYSLSKSRLIADWSVEYMNPGMTPNGMLLDDIENIQPTFNLCLHCV